MSGCHAIIWHACLDQVTPVLAALGHSSFLVARSKDLMCVTTKAPPSPESSFRTSKAAQSCLAVLCHSLETASITSRELLTVSHHIPLSVMLQIHQTDSQMTSTAHSHLSSILSGAQPGSETCITHPSHRCVKRTRIGRACRHVCSPAVWNVHFATYTYFRSLHDHYPSLRPSSSQRSACPTSACSVMHTVSWFHVPV